MPTENRSSNTEMISVPRELLQRIDKMYTDGMSIFGECEELRALLTQPAEQHQGEPVACAHQWTDDGEFLLVCTECGAQENHDPGWRDMASAPRDGTMLRLLVRFEEHSTEDDEDAPTIGANNFDNDGEDRWQFAGWYWSHDHFVDGKGEPIGWLPMFDEPKRTDPGEVERLRKKSEHLTAANLLLMDDCDTLRAHLANRDELIDRLRTIGTRNVCHVNNGSCPGEVEGYAARDNDCPACQALMDADVLFGKS